MGKFRNSVRMTKALLLLFSASLCLSACSPSEARQAPEANFPPAAELPSDSVEVAAIDEVPDWSNKVTMDTRVKDLDEPWGFTFLDKNTVLVTEKKGRLLIAVAAATPIEVQGIPEVTDNGQGGLLDVALDPDYANNGWVYLTFSHPHADDPKKAMTKIVRGKISDFKWTNEQVLFEAKPEHYVKSRVHFGSRITFDQAGHLYFSIGDRGQMKMAQDVTRPNGKVHRINRDGSIPADNPFVGTEGAYPSIFSYGNRNPQGLIVHPETDVVWETEHGPRGGDELNVIRPGVNYGWPEISYGINYNGTELTPFKTKPGMAQPESQWTPSIAVCGLDVYTGDLFPDWKGRLLVGSLAYETLRLVSVEGDQYQSEVTVLEAEGRIRDVTTGPDGAIYVALPDSIVRLSPANP